MIWERTAQSTERVEVSLKITNQKRGNRNVVEAFARSRRPRGSTLAFGSWGLANPHPPHKGLRPSALLSRFCIPHLNLAAEALKFDNGRKNFMSLHRRVLQSTHTHALRTGIGQSAVQSSHSGQLVEKESDSTMSHHFLLDSQINEPKNRLGPVEKSFKTRKSLTPSTQIPLPLMPRNDVSRQVALTSVYISANIYQEPQTSLSPWHSNLFCT
jgi:hypothetical protein